MKTAFSEADTNSIRRSIALEQYKLISLYPCPLTLQDALELFVRPEHHEICIQAPKICDLPYSIVSQSVSLPFQIEPSIEFSFSYTSNPKNGSAVFLWPKYADRPHPSAPVHLLKKLNTYVEARVELGIQAGALLTVFDALNEVCRSPAEVAFVWPSITALTVDLPEKTKARLHRRVTSTPRVGPALRQVCQGAATTLMMLTMAKDVQPDPHETLISMSHDGAKKLSRFVEKWTIKPV